MMSRLASLYRQIRCHGSTLLLLAIATALAYPLWMSRWPMALNDLQQLNGPQRSLLVWFYKNGHMPLWNPFNFAGQPFFAAGQSGPLYLPNLVFLLLPLPAAMKVSYLLHELLGAFGMYALLWRFTHSKLASFAGGISFITCGFLLGHEIHTQMFDAFCWLPLVFWLLQRLFDRPSLARASWVAVGFAFEVYAGHPQVTFYTCLLLGLYTVFVAVHDGLQETWRTGRNKFLHAVLALALGLLLSAAQWLPTLNLALYSYRSDVSKAFLVQGSLPWSGLAQYLTPFSAGGGYSGLPFSAQTFTALYNTHVYWEFFCYVGIIALTLATALVISEGWRNATVAWFGALGLFFLGLAVGYHTGLVVILQYVPGFDLFRVPARYTGLTGVLICILAALAIVELLRGNRRLCSVTAATAGGYAVTDLALRFGGPLQSAPAPVFWVSFFALVAVVLLCLPNPLHSSRFAKFRQIPAVTLALLMIADAMVTGVSLSPLVLEPHASYTYEPPSATYLQEKLHGAQSTNNPYPFARFAALDQSSLSQDRVLGERIPALNGEDSLVPQWYQEDVNLTWDDTTLLQQPLSLFNLLDVKFVTTAPGDAVMPLTSNGVPAWSGQLPKLPPGQDTLEIKVSSFWSGSPAPLFSLTVQAGSQAFQQYFSSQSAQTYALALPADWPHNVPTTVRITNENRSDPLTLQSLRVYGPTYSSAPTHIHQTLSARPWKLVFETSKVWVWQNPNPLRAAWVTPDKRAPGLHSNDATTLVKWSPNHQVWRVRGGTAGWFVLSQMYDPNWVATVNGTAVPVTKVGNVLTGVPVHAGTSTISLTFQPKSFRYGVFISLAALIAMLIAAAGSVRGSAKNRE